MNPLLMHFVSGDSFFSGSFMLLIGIGLSFFKSKSFLFRIGINLSLIMGLIFIIMSASYVVTGFSWILTSLILFFVSLFHFRQKISKNFLHIVRGIIILVVFSGCCIRFSDSFMPELSNRKFNKIYLLGDSISGGVGFRGERTWSEVFKDKYGVEVNSQSVGGGEIPAATYMAANIKDKRAFILLEIGGNDILRSKSSEQFEKDLNELFKKVSGKERVIAMFELPLPPLKTDYNKIQKQLAAKYGVILIPKRYFAKILTGDKYTVDGLHLSNAGHERMADIIWSLFEKMLISGNNVSK